MSTTYADSGRTQQKQRTRSELIAAARGLITKDGSAPTVAEAAATAHISRTTAYRYFRSQAELLAAAQPEVEVKSWLPPDIGDDPRTRLLAVVGQFVAMVLANEPQQRTMLRLSLEPSTTAAALPLRQGRAIGWFIEALEPARDRLGEDGVRRLALAVRSAVGIEALVWLVDVAGLTRQEAADLMLSTASALSSAALDPRRAARV